MVLRSKWFDGDLYGHDISWPVVASPPSNGDFHSGCEAARR